MKKPVKKAAIQSMRLHIVNVAMVNGKAAPKVEDMDAMSTLLLEGWKIATCAATRAEPWNHERLYYTLVR